MMSTLAGSLFLLALVASPAEAAVKIEPMKHDIQQITATNFDGVIGKFRDSSVSSLWFFKSDNKEDQTFLDTYNSVASDLKGMAKVCAIDCGDWPQFCEKNKVTQTPAVMVYPSNPMPAFA